MFVTYLVDVRILTRVSQNVELGVDVIEKVDDFDGPLGRGVFAAEGVESHDTTEQDGDVVVAFGGNRTFVAQLVSYRRRENRVQQPKRQKPAKQLLLLIERLMKCANYLNRIVHWCHCCQTVIP